jgi:creatinine amidohydrolase
MKWTELVPSEFKRLAGEEGQCVVPMGSLERHGEHIPFGCDVVVAETIAEKAAEITPAVVFPGYFLAQVHEAACFTGTVNLPQALAIEVLAQVLKGIAANGFKKIAILNGHGGNRHFLEYFAMSQLDEPREYVLYIVDPSGAMTAEEKKVFNGLWETAPLGHACEEETSIYIACRPGLVRLDLVPGAPVLPENRFAHLRSLGIHNALWWYADYPQNVIGVPGKASQEKGEKALDLLVKSAARALQAVKDDTVAPALQKEFLERVSGKGK